MSANDATVLIVDDSVDSLELLRVILETANHSVQSAEGGRQAIEMARTGRPGLILLDVMMPDVSGLEVCVELKKHAATRDIPVIFLSGKSRTADKVEGFRVGGVDYITKPFIHEEVLARVKTHLALSGASEALREKNAELLQEIERRTEIEREREALIVRLETALQDVKKLRSMLPICANCKKIRDDKGYWSRIEEYFLEHADVTFTHGICEECVELLYGKD